MQMAEGALVQRLSVLPSASEPGGDGGLSVAEDSFGSRKVKPFGQRVMRTMAIWYVGVFSRYKGV